MLLNIHDTSPSLLSHMSRYRETAVALRTAHTENNAKIHFSSQKKIITAISELHIVFACFMWGINNTILLKHGARTTVPADLLK